MMRPACAGPQLTSHVNQSQSNRITQQKTWAFRLHGRMAAHSGSGKIDRGRTTFLFHLILFAAFVELHTVQSVAEGSMALTPNIQSKEPR